MSEQLTPIQVRRATLKRLRGYKQGPRVTDDAVLAWVLDRLEMYMNEGKE